MALTFSSVIDHRASAVVTFFPDTRLLLGIRYDEAVPPGRRLLCKLSVHREPGYLDTIQSRVDTIRCWQPGEASATGR